MIALTSITGSDLNVASGYQEIAYSTGMPAGPAVHQVRMMIALSSAAAGTHNIGVKITANSGDTILMDYTTMLTGGGGGVALLLLTPPFVFTLASGLSLNLSSDNAGDTAVDVLATIYTDDIEYVMEYRAIRTPPTTNSPFDALANNTKLGTMLVADGDVYQFTANAVELVSVTLTAGNITSIVSGLLSGGAATEASLTAIKGAGWTTQTLVGIDTLLDSVKAKTDVIGTSAGNTGLPATITGAAAATFIARARAKIRQVSGEPAVNAKYTDADLLEWLENGYGHIFGAINRRSPEPATVTVDLSLESDVSVYVLPPTVQRVVNVQLCGSDGTVRANLTTGSKLAAGGAGFSLEGNTIHVNFSYAAGDLLRVEYVPDGCARLHYATIDTTDATGAKGGIVNGTDGTATVRLPTQANVALTGAGTVDLRANAYAGCVLRLLSAGARSVQHDRLIKAYDPARRLLTVEPAFGTFTQEATAVGQPVHTSTSALTTTESVWFDDMVGLSVTFATSGTSYIIASVTSPTVVVLTGNASGEASGDAVTVTGVSEVPQSVGTTHVLYEIAPPLIEQLDAIIAVWVARILVGLEREPVGYNQISKLYAEMLAELTWQKSYQNGTVDGLQRSHRDIPRTVTTGRRMQY